MYQTIKTIPKYTDVQEVHSSFTESLYSPAPLGVIQDGLAASLAKELLLRQLIAFDKKIDVNRYTATTVATLKVAGAATKFAIRNEEFFEFNDELFSVGEVQHALKLTYSERFI